ncbi:uncharacterized protein LOC136033568 [Artemia franciscana]|uniref:Uncharacterized protein n=1 Tax=Artemia franciscana TaxID=6661 RepID=A0AA88LA29_ARTSF|nr:hypothetical protein QYM36_002314 [Artemia franciscana]
MHSESNNSSQIKKEDGDGQKQEMRAPTQAISIPKVVEERIRDRSRDRNYCRSGMIERKEHNNYLREGTIEKQEEISQEHRDEDHYLRQGRKELNYAYNYGNDYSDTENSTLRMDDSIKSQRASVADEILIDINTMPSNFMSGSHTEGRSYQNIPMNIITKPLVKRENRENQRKSDDGSSSSGTGKEEIDYKTRHTTHCSPTREKKLYPEKAPRRRQREADIVLDNIASLSRGSSSTESASRPESREKSTSSSRNNDSNEEIVSVNDIESSSLTPTSAIGGYQQDRDIFKGFKRYSQQDRPTFKKEDLYVKPTGLSLFLPRFICGLVLAATAAISITWIVLGIKGMVTETSTDAKRWLKRILPLFLPITTLTILTIFCVKTCKNKIQDWQERRSV